MKQYCEATLKSVLSSYARWHNRKDYTHAKVNNWKSKILPSLTETKFHLNSKCKVTSTPSALCHLTSTATASTMAWFQAGFTSPCHCLITYLQLNPVFYLQSLQCLYVMSKFVVKRHSIQLLDKAQFFCNLLRPNEIWQNLTVAHLWYWDCFD